MTPRTKDSAGGLDDRDRALLRALQRNGRGTYADLGACAGVSESVCLRRIKSMEQAGIIQGYTAVVNAKAVGLPVTVMVKVTLLSQADDVLKAFETEVAKIPEVVECYLLTGSSDYHLQVVARDIDDLERVHSRRLTKLAGVARVNSSLVMRTVVRRNDLPIYP